MAEQYPPGVNRIFYKSTGFIEGLTVSVDILYPDMNDDDGIILIEVGGGLYYFDYDFPSIGVYAAVFYEDGVKRCPQVYNIRRESGATGGGLVMRFGNGIINLR